MENMREMIEKLAGAGVALFARGLSQDIMCIAIAPNSNTEALGRVIGHFAIAYALMEMTQAQLKGGVKIPEDLLLETGKQLGITEAKRMLGELESMKAMDKADKAPGNDPNIKKSWSSEI